MALTDEGGSNGMVMPVAPFYGSGNGNNNGFGGDWAWIILLLLLGWGNNGFGGGYGMTGGYGNVGGVIYPWMNQSNQISDGFQNQLMNDNITEIRSGVSNLSTQLCNCCGDMQMALANGFAGVEQGANTRQMANMQQAFAAQTAMSQGFNQLGSQFADCCCENRLANCQTQNIIQNEGNATRFADANNTRDIIDSNTRGTQAILDKLCQLELDGFKAQVEAKNDRIAELQTQLNFANLNASQIGQTSNIVDGIYNRLNNCPIGTTPVYGRTPIFQCNQNQGCGCGCSGGF